MNFDKESESRIILFIYFIFLLRGCGGGGGGGGGSAGGRRRGYASKVVDIKRMTSKIVLSFLFCGEKRGRGGCGRGR